MSFCAVPGCLTKTPARALMCAEHWRRVPKSLHNAIYNGFREWERTSKPPKYYVTAVRQAVLAAQGPRRPDPAQLTLPL